VFQATQMVVVQSGRTGGGSSEKHAMSYNGQTFKSFIKTSPNISLTLATHRVSRSRGVSCASVLDDQSRRKSRL
jgi:hypothetical protein